MSNTHKTIDPQAVNTGKSVDSGIGKILTQVAVGAAILGGICYLSKTQPQINKLVNKGIDTGRDALSKKATEAIGIVESTVMNNTPRVSDEAKTITKGGIDSFSNALKKHLS